MTYVSSTAQLAAFVENLTYVGDSSATLIGNGLDNVIIGGARGDTLRALSGDDTLNGGIDADRMVGGDDNDTYYVDNVGDEVVETQGSLRQDPFTGAYYYAGGNDTVMTTIASPKQLTPFVENLIYLGVTQATLAGNNLDNIIAGGAGNDRMAGFAGKDTMRGGAGADYMAGGDDDDTYYVDDAGDQVVEGTGFLADRPDPRSAILRRRRRHRNDDDFEHGPAGRVCREPDLRWRHEYDPHWQRAGTIPSRGWAATTR